jgi:hypothetical protein
VVGEDFRRKMSGGALVMVVAERRTGEETAEGWSSVWSCSETRSVGEKEREREITQPAQTAGGAGGSGEAAWQPLGTSARRGGTRVDQCGQRGRREEEQHDAWSRAQRGAEQQSGAQDRVGAAACSRRRNRESSGLGKTKGT